MAASRLNELIKVGLGIYAVYLLVVIARAGYETGQVLAGKISVAEAMARFDVSGSLLVLGGVVLFVALNKSRLKP